MVFRQKTLHNRCRLPATGLLLLLFSTAAYAVPLLGDVNQDNVIDMLDSLKIVRCYVKLETLTCDPRAADVNGDGDSDVLDALCIAQYYVKLIPYFPILPENWSELQDFLALGAGAEAKLKKNRLMALDAVSTGSVNYAYDSFTGLPEIPVVITTDAMLHLFHVTLAHMLETAENTELPSLMTVFWETLYTKAAAEYTAFAQTASPALLQGGELLLLYAAVGKALITGSRTATDPDFPEIGLQADILLDKIYNYRQPAAGAAGAAEDYSQYEPRSHYTRTEVLKRYFRGLKWTQQQKFNIRDPENPQAGLVQFHAALILAKIIDSNVMLRDYWTTIYTFMSAITNPSASITPLLLADRYKTFFNEPNLNRLAEISGSPENIVSLQALLLSDTGLQQKYIQLLGEPLFLDADVLQQTVEPLVDGRILPSGLDVAASVLDSEAAAAQLSIQTAGLSRPASLQHSAQLTALQQTYSSLTPQDWQASVYNSWFSTLRLLSDPPAAAAPAAMQSTLWAGEKLNTQLASWAQLHSGSINFYPTPLPTPTPTPSGTGNIGDVNNSGKIDIIDALLVAQYYIGMNPYGFDPSVADVTGDGQINILDALVISQYTVGLISQFPAGEPAYLPCLVEPYPAFFTSLAELCDKVLALLDTIEARPYSGFSLPHKAQFTQIRSWAVTFTAYAQQILAGQALSQPQNRTLKLWGRELNTFFTTAGFVQEKDVKTRVICDLFTAADSILHVGVGNLHALILVYEVPGRILPLAGVGYVLSYYELATPTGERLNDEEWETLLTNGQAVWLAASGELVQ